MSYSSTLHLAPCTLHLTPSTQAIEREVPKRILLVRCDRIGDLVLTTPVISYIHQQWGRGVSISMLVNQRNVQLIEGHPELEEIITLDKKGIHQGIIGTFRLVKQLRQRRFDAVFVFHPTVRVHWILFLAGIPRRIGYPAKLGRWLLTDLIPDRRSAGGKHEVENVFEVIAKSPWGNNRSQEGSGLHFWIAQSPLAEHKILQTLASCDFHDNQPLILLHPGASCPSKCWPPQRFIEVGNRLRKQWGFQIAVVAGAGDRDLGTRVARKILGALDFSGKTTLLELSALLKRSQLLISNDSGPVHMAVAVGTPVLSLFGRNQPGLSPLRWRPLGIHDRYLHKDVGCFVCLAHRCNLGFECLEAISVEEVVTAAKEMLGNSDIKNQIAK